MTQYQILKDVLAAYNRLASKGTALALTWFKVTPRGGLDPHDVAPDEGAQGWLRHRSAAYRIGAGSDSEKPLGTPDDPGPLLAGEWRLDEKTSVHVRPDPDKPGRLIRYTIEERSAEAEGFEPALCEEIEAVARPAPDNQAEAEDAAVCVYRVFWGAEGDDDHALRRLAARFAGFSRKNIAVPTSAGKPRRSKREQSA